MSFKKIEYKELNARQKENYNFHHVAAVLVEYGFACLWLNDDWQGADFIANHVDGEVFLKVQLKGRLTLDKKYRGKNIFVVFRENNQWYLYPHDEMMKKLLKKGFMKGAKAWDEKGNYSWARVPKTILTILNSYKI